eukprot:m.82563 g.82563  ORF g.82563 m.82563 type:complete len:466 (+) comp14303_c0_seq1:87-1484(+)
MVFDTVPVAPEAATRNAILDERNEVLSQPMDWNTLSVLNFVDPQGLRVLQEYETSNQDARRRAIETTGRDMVRVLLELFMQVAAVDKLKYIITTFDRLAEDDISTVDTLIDVCKSLESPRSSPVAPFLRKLESASPYIAHQSSRMIARLIERGAPYEAQDLGAYINWLFKELSGGNMAAVRLALAAVASILTVQENRVVIARTPGFVDALKVLLRPEAHFQVLYQALTCLWMISFSEVALSALGLELLHAIVVNVAEVIREAKKEKVLRVAIAFFRNAIQKSEREMAMELSIAMVSHKLLPVMENLSRGSAYQDEELVEDVQFLLENLRGCYDQMSSFDEYVAELKSGQLEWSPVHRSKRFWSENALRLNDNKHEILKYLVAYLDKDDPTCLAVAAHDCGEYVHHYPFGKKVLEELAAKSRIMQLMQHENPTVKYEALIAVQKMISDNWEFLGAQAKKAVQGQQA